MGQCFRMKFDKKYFNLCKNLLRDGINSITIEGKDILSLSFCNLEFDLRDEFPISQFKEIDFNEEIITMLWMWQMQSNDVRKLHERGIYKFDEWMVDEDGIYRIYEDINSNIVTKYEADKEVIVYDPYSLPLSDPFGYENDMLPKFDKDGFLVKAKSLMPNRNISSALYLGKEFAYTLGTNLGYILNYYNMSKNMENSLKNRDTDVNGSNVLYQNVFLRTITKELNIYSCNWYTSSNRLNLHIHLKDCNLLNDLVGVVVQYATLCKMMAQVGGLEPRTINFSIENAYINIKQIEELKSLIDRWNLYQRMSRLNTDELMKMRVFLTDLIKNEKYKLSKNTLNMVDIKIKIIDMLLNPKNLELWLNPNITSFDAFDSSINLNDIKMRMRQRN